VHNLGPDVLEWQDLEQGYTDWLYTGLAGSLTRFYDRWQAEDLALQPDQGITVYPPPWSREGKDLSTTSRTPAPPAQPASYYLDTAHQLGSHDQS
jgi:hypothetical protein